MKCKYCQEELPTGVLICPHCGKDNTHEEVEVVPPQRLQPEVAEKQNDSQMKKMKRTAIISGCIAALAVLALLLTVGIRGGLGQENGKKLDIASWFDWEIFRENDIHKQNSYSVSDKQAANANAQVVATMGNAKLTNGQLQIYYWQKVIDFLQNEYPYYSYMGMNLGLDPSKPLSEQTCAFKDEDGKELTWEQYFLESALGNWKSEQAFALAAADSGYQLSGEYLQQMETLDENLENAAKQYKFESVDAFLQSQFSTGCTAADFKAVMELQMNCYGYFTQCQDAIAELSAKELEVYYQIHKEELEKAGIQQDGKCVTDVRHILVLMDNIVKEVPDVEGTKGADGYTPAQWEACQKAAQAILDQWLAGEKTDASFAALANEKSHDKGGQVTDGGIYTGITTSTSFVQEFLDWCFAEGRKVGDYGLVKTQFGYHVMYLSAQGEELWIKDTQSAYQKEESQKIVNEILDKYDSEVNYKKIALGNVNLGA